jgi:hypothetical protein
VRHERNTSFHHRPDRNLTLIPSKDTQYSAIMRRVKNHQTNLH